MSSGGMKRFGSRLLRDKHEVLAESLQQQVIGSGCTPIVDCAGGCRVSVSGVLRSVTLRARSNVPAVEAELYDGSGVLTIVWLGRRRIAGVEPGRKLTASGRITNNEGQPKMFNPRYDLGPAVHS